MGQAATEARVIEKILMITDFPRFMASLGVLADEFTRRPAMEPDYSVHVKDAKVAAFRDGLLSLRINGTPIEIRDDRDGFFAISLAGRENYHKLGVSVELEGRATTLQALGMENSTVEDLTSCNAYHIPQGVLLTYDPRAPKATVAQSEVSTCEIVPAILRNFSVPVPSYMRGGSGL
jgi:hypothetical protein